ncbi:MAG: hypothetical protein LBT27_05845 [Prevotellaceae bacterium]|jgi:hypothetical protein|nr:hypothetical protein [Prevotellaceae bacterium]
MKGTFIKNENFKNPGEYKKTSLDERKENADFLIENCNGDSWTIYPKTFNLKERKGIHVYSNGNYEVTDKVLRNLKEKYTYECNF